MVNITGLKHNFKKQYWIRLTKMLYLVIISISKQLICQCGKRYLVNFADKIIVIKESNMEQIPETGRYRHYKGNEYQLLYIATHSETLEKMVVYKALYGNGDIWVRPLYMWNENIKVNGEDVKRFKYISD